MCYKNGERCTGARSKPYVPYHKFRDGVCYGDHTEWGKTCAAKRDQNEAPVYGEAQRCTEAPKYTEASKYTEGYQ